MAILDAPATPWAPLPHADVRGRAEAALVSAHRGAEVDRPPGPGADFVELDLQRCGDGTLVLFHDAAVRVRGRAVPVAELTYPEMAGITGRSGARLRYRDALAALAQHGGRAHLDLKLTSPAAAYREPHATFEVEATRLAVEALGADNVIVTTLEDRSVLAVRTWACSLDRDELLVGLSLGRDCHGLSRATAIRTHTSELFPSQRYLACGANLVVAHHWLARLSAARFAAERHLPLLVWTVDRAAGLRYWLRPGRAWLVTTNRPREATRIRAEITAQIRESLPAAR